MMGLLSSWAENISSFQALDMITSHTDVVGSLLRPSELLRALEKPASGHITPVAFT